MRRLKEAGVVPAPFTTYAYYNSDKFAFYGAEMMQRCMAFRSFLDAGIAVAAGSDFSPGPFDPRMGMQGMVTRTGWDGKVWGPNQRITVQEALQINTLDGAYNSHDETLKSSIMPGKLADFVVLAENPFTVDPEKIKILRSCAPWWADLYRLPGIAAALTGPCRKKSDPVAKNPPHSSCASHDSRVILPQNGVVPSSKQGRS